LWDTLCMWHPWTCPHKSVNAKLSYENPNRMWTYRCGEGRLLDALLAEQGKVDPSHILYIRYYEWYHRMCL